MTHRVHPYIFRIGETTTWKSRWFQPKKFRAVLRQDTLLREWLRRHVQGMHVAAVEIERSPNTLQIIVKTSRPGILIGRGGEGIERLRREVESKLRAISRRFKTGPEKRELKLTIEEVRSPETVAAIVAEQIREDILKRTRFRRMLKQTVEKVMAHKEVQGVKVMLSGRLDGAEMSRVEWAKRGRIPLQTIRANVDYAFAEAHTTYGTIGIKVWIYKGDVFADKSIQNKK